MKSTWASAQHVRCGRMTFFQPRDTFLGWLVAHAAGRPVFDIGCGNRVFTNRMEAAGIPKVLGIDIAADLIPYPVPELMRTLIADATDCRLLRNTPGLALFCRPSHTGWVLPAIDNLHPESEALYISAPGNRVIDLPDRVVRFLKAPGLTDGERVLQVRRTIFPGTGNSS